MRASTRTTREIVPVLLLCCAVFWAHAGDMKAPPVQESDLDRAEKEFADEWDAPQKRARAQMNPEKAEEMVGPLAMPVEEPPSSPTPVASTLAAARFGQLKQEIQRLLRAQDWALAQEGLKDLKAVAVVAGPAQEQQAHALAVDAWMATGSVAQARQSAQAWLLSCGPTRVDACRKKAMSALAKADGRGHAKPSVKNKSKAVEGVERADLCLVKAEAKRGAVVPPCLEDALVLYRNQGDRLMVARGLWVKASAEQSLPRFSEAERACEQERCLDIRRRSLKAMTALGLKKGDVEAAAQAALKNMGLAARSLPPTQRSYAWTKDVERVCARYDAQKGEGACRKLEKRLNAAYAFKDFSTTRVSSREGLTQAQVAQVNEHFSVTLQDCLAEEAARLLPPASVKVHVRWAVSNQGRVEKVQVDQGDGPFGKCLKQSFAVWRYPKYQGELQHVEQQFTVSARAR